MRKSRSKQEMKQLFGRVVARYRGIFNKLLKRQGQNLKEKADLHFLPPDWDEHGIEEQIQQMELWRNIFVHVIGGMTQEQLTARGHWWTRQLRITDDILTELYSKVAGAADFSWQNLRSPGPPVEGRY